MRIGIFTDFYKPSINGVTTSIENYRYELERLGHQVYIFAPFVKGCKKEKNVYRLPSTNEFSPKGSPIAIPILPIINRTIKPLNLDIIHTQVPFPIGFLGHRAARKLDLPEVHTYHTHLTEYAHYFPSEILQPIVKYGLKKIARIFCNYSDVVIAPSKSVKELLKKYGVKSPIIVNQSGVCTKDFKKLNDSEISKILKHYSIPKNKEILMFAGRLAPEKNLLFLLKTFKYIHQKNPNAYLMIVGGGPSEEQIKKEIAKLDLSKSAQVTGFVSKEEIIKIFDLAKIFVFPSLTETQGLVICEALAAGVPVVAINKMGPRDLIKNNINGFLVTNKQSVFAKKIIEILDNHKLHKKLAKGAKKSAQLFSIEKRTEELIKIYKKAILEHKTHDHDTLLNKFFNYFK